MLVVVVEKSAEQVVFSKSVGRVVKVVG